MRIEAVIKTGAKRQEIICQRDGRYRISVTQRPVEGRANEAVVKSLAEYFGVSKSKVVITQGLKSKLKRIEILG